MRAGCPQGTPTMSPDPDSLVMKYSPSDARIAEVRAEHAALIDSLPALVEAEDLTPIQSALRTIVPMRTEVEKVRVNLKAEALAYGRRVDAEAKRLTGLILAFETPIREAKDAIEAKERERAEAKVKAEEAAKAAEAKRIADEAAAQRRAEEDRIAAERKKLDEERAAIERVRKEDEERRAEQQRLQDARAAELEAQAKKIADEQARLDREKQEAADKVRREQEAAELKVRIEREAKEKAERHLAEVEAARVEQERQAKVLAEREAAEKKAELEARPDVKKINDFGLDLQMGVQTLWPQVRAGSRATQFLADIRAELESIIDRLKTFKFPTRGK